MIRLHFDYTLQRILLNFTDINVDALDILDIFLGPVPGTHLTSLAGMVDEQMSLIASSNNTIISLTTDSTLTKNGFQFFFEFIGKDFQVIFLGLKCLMDKENKCNIDLCI